jgi:hypothetical protein
MKSIALLVLAVFLVVTGVFAQEAVSTDKAAAPVVGETAPVVGEVAPVVEETAPVTPAEEILMPLKGVIIDNLCAEANKADLEIFVPTHNKECTLKPECAASGYSIYSNNMLMKFDVASNAKVEEFLKKEVSKLQVMVEVKKAGEELSLVSIKNQE